MSYYNGLSIITCFTFMLQIADLYLICLVNTEEVKSDAVNIQQFYIQHRMKVVLSAILSRPTLEFNQVHISYVFSPASLYASS